jgi:hypothetical protein
MAGEMTLEVDGTQRIGTAATRPYDLGHDNELIRKATTRRVAINYARYTP